MRLSQDGINLIKDFEICRLHAYQDAGGRWAIGYGHTADVQEGMVITKPQANTYLLDDLVWAENVVNHYVRVVLKQHQFDALVSFTYDLGEKIFQHSDLLSLINAGRFVQAAETFPEYNQWDERRKAERALFLSPVQSLLKRIVWWWSR